MGTMAPSAKRDGAAGQRAHVYTRVSTGMQATEGTSLEVQEERCVAEVERRGMQLVTVHTDAGISGAKADRPALTNLLEAVRRGEVDAIFVSKLDRLGRSQRNLVPLLTELDDRGVLFVSLAESFDSNDPYGRMMRTLFGGFAELERDVISERTRSGSRKRVEQGGWLGGRPPYGYQVDKSGPFPVLVPDPDEVVLIEFILKLLLDDGVKMTEVVHRLNALGMTPRRAPLWNTPNLRNMLRRGQFGAEWTYCKPARRVAGEPITIKVPPVISAEREADLIAYLDATSRSRHSGGVHPLSGRLFCPCGMHMFGSERGDRYSRRYHCSHSKHVPGKPFCNQPTLHSEQVEAAVWAQVMTLLGNPTSLLAAAASVVPAEAADDSKGTLEAAQRAVDRSRDAVADITARGIALGLDDETLISTIAKLKDQLNAAIRHRDAVVAAAAVTGEADQWLLRVQRLADYARERLQTPDRQLRADIFAALDLKVYVQAHNAVDRVELHLTGDIPADLISEGEDGQLVCGAATSRSSGTPSTGWMSR
jgi:DNA invertase Pin-like site-specific DNA recombinase